MNFQVLHSHYNLLLRNKIDILNDWIDYEDVKIIFEKHGIKSSYFLEHYASFIFDYYIGVISGKNILGDCPVMGEYLRYLRDKHIMPDELFMICTHFRKALMHCMLKENIVTIELFDELTYIIDHNLNGVLKRFREIMMEKDSQIKHKTQLLIQYKKAIDEGAIISTTDKHGIITYANEQFCKISGFTREELIGKSHSVTRHSDSSTEMFKDLWKTLKEKRQWHGLIKNRTKTGDAYYVNTLIAPIFDTKGEVFEYFSIRNDLTEIFELQNELVETQKEIIYKVGDIAETRSQETGNHVKRVSEYAKLLGELADLDEELIEWLYFAAPMHDIGKIGIPDNILTKPGALSADEWNIMKTHSQIGYNIFKNSKRPILQTAATISHEHHEKYDGSGYPNGISGESINILARIIAVVDVFDALGSDRVYKKAWPLNEILDFFKAQRGKHFDPHLVDLFLENLESFLEIRDQYTELKY